MLDRRAFVPLAPLAIRAVLMAVGLRLTLMVVSALLVSIGGDPVDNPLGIVGLNAALGIVDIHRRHEQMLWANLGYPFGVIAVLFAGVAAIIELVVAL